MKKSIFLAIGTLLAAACFSPPAEAQIFKLYPTVKDTLVNADNTIITIGGLTSDVVAIHFEADKVSGAVGGTATLQGTRDGTNWSTVGTAFTFTDIARLQTAFEPSRLVWARYRVLAATTGTCKINHIKVHTVRRNG